MRSMRCTAYCTAGSYALSTLYEAFKATHEAHLTKDVLHIFFPEEDRHLFFFSYGVYVCWGFSEREELIFIEHTLPASLDPITNYEWEHVDYTYSASSQIQRGKVLLKERDIDSKLAISYGLGQSVKLAVFEELIDTTIAKTKYLPEELAKNGKIKLSRKVISQKIGRLVIERNSVNLHSDILDEPDFFWEHSELLPLYHDLSSCFDINRRLEVLNTRLSILGDLLDILNDQIRQRHSTFLEWTIIWLIFIEVALALLSDLFHII